MLRIPVYSVEDNYEREELLIPSPSDLTIDTSALHVPACDVSPAPSVGSAVESVEEAG
jgi:hypothetical protein